MQDQSIYEKLREYAKSDAYPFHMPGHKRKVDWISDVYDIDITEIDGFDDLHHADGILEEGMARMANAVGAKKSYYIVNGSTCGILAAIYAACPQGATVAVARNTHKSVAHAIMLRGLKPTYIYPQNVDNLCISGQIIPKDVEKAYEQSPEIAAVILTSPTYEGIVSNIRQIADVVHAHGGVLIVDEAHGAHFGFHEYFPQNANVRGADIVIHSLHKTLPSLTQTALLHMNGNLVDRDSVRRYLHMLQSSSPSYILMASIDECIRLVNEERERVFKPYVEMLRQLRKEIRKLKNLQLLETMQYDASKIVISARGRMSGKELQEILLENDHLQMEMAAGSYVIAMTGPGDTQEGMNRLLNALRNLDKRLDEVLQGNRKQDKNLDEVLSGNRKMDAATMKKDPGFCRHPLIPAERVVESAKVKGRKGLAVPWQEAAGKVSLEFVYLYPPGIPIVVPGERVSEEAVQQILDYEKNGFTIEGTKKKDRLEVLKNG